LTYEYAHLSRRMVELPNVICILQRLFKADDKQNGKFQ
jgi:hypothetical protein